MSEKQKLMRVAQKLINGSRLNAEEALLAREHFPTVELLMKFRKENPKQ